MKSKIYILLVILGVLTVGCKNNYNKGILTFDDNASIDDKCRLSTKVTPTDKQLAWQKLETTAFIHFGINTFTGHEWGNGKEDPTLFLPTDLNTDQWIETLKDAGFKLVIITAKHHDGFCLWPTSTTAHSVKSSNWLEGNGDVVKMVQESCKKYDVKFGIYLSPWDRNAASYGTGDAYNKFFVAQLTELLSNYGKIDEVWFDGACGEGANGKKQTYDFPSYYAVIDSLQPDAVVAIMGDDVRWCGNESGLGRDTEWSVTPLQNDAREDGKVENLRLNISNTSSDLGSRYTLVKSKSIHWWPSEVDVSIRPGWFYHQEEDNRVKTLDQLVDIYFNSVGKNSVLLLNVPPNKEGRIAKIDSLRLHAFGEHLREMYKQDMVIGSKTWHGNVGTGEHIYNINEGCRFNVIELAEDITKGQRVERFTVLAKIHDKWEQVANGTTIGYKRLLRIPLIEASQIKLIINNARADFYIDHVRAYETKEFISTPIISRDKNGMVTIKGNPNASIHYTTDGTEPTLANAKYTSPFPFTKKGTIKAIAFFNGGEMASETATHIFDYPKTKWKVINVSDEERGFEAEQAIDDVEENMWHTPWDDTHKKMPHYIEIDCGEELNIIGFSMTPRNDGSVSGIPYRYNFYVSEDGKKWNKIISKGEFSNIKNNPQQQIIKFNECVNMRYFKFEALEEVNEKQWISVAEIGVISE